MQRFFDQYLAHLIWGAVLVALFLRMRSAMKAVQRTEDGICVRCGAQPAVESIRDIDSILAVCGSCSKVTIQHHRLGYRFFAAAGVFGLAAMTFGILYDATHGYSVSGDYLWMFGLACGAPLLIAAFIKSRIGKSGTPIAAQRADGADGASRRRAR
jgi:hypothetical protein